MQKPETGFSAGRLAARLFAEWQLPDNACLQVALSGGLDSTVLVHALVELRGQHPFTLSAVHVDHRLRPESSAWAEHCAQLCLSLDIPFILKQVQIPDDSDEGLEAAARRARYNALQDQLSSGAFLLTAHHRDDQAETVLLQLMRGSGVAGLAAMPGRAPFGKGELLRPLLEFDRDSLRTYALAKGLRWIEDPSNQHTHLRRNFLRHEIFPRLTNVWPRATEMLARSASHAAEGQELLDELAAMDFGRCGSPASGERGALSVAALRTLSEARQRNVLRFWLRQQGFRAPAMVHVDEILVQIRHTPRSQHACVHWDDVEIWRYRDLMVAVQAAPLPGTDVGCNWDMREPLELPGVGCLRTEVRRGSGIALDRAPERVRVSIRQGGEVVKLPGRQHRHVLKKLLQSEGVPPWRRARLPLLYAGVSLVAVADLWTCEPFAAGAGEEGLAVLWDPYPGSGRDHFFAAKNR